MAASMIFRGLSRARRLCIGTIQNEFEHVCVLPRQQYVCYSVKEAKKLKQGKSTDDSQSKKKKYLGETPLYDIYMIDDYPPQKFTFEECINMHKEAAQPAMTNTLHVQIFADIELNLNTTKKTKFMKNIRGLLEFPHPFQHDQKKNIFVFSEDPTDWDLVKSLGVGTAGGEELVSYLQQGVIRKEDINKCDFVFATPSMAVKLLKMRNILMDKTPTLNNGCIVNEFEDILKKHMDGVKYTSHKLSDGVGNVQIPFGQLSQDTKSLEENFSYMILQLSNLKPPKQEPILDSIRFIAPPSTEIFNVQFDELLTKAKEQQNTVVEIESDDDD